MRWCGKSRSRAARVAISLLLLLMPFAAAVHAAEPRVALVIGNSAYTDIRALPNPARDAELMSAALADVGFDVVVKIDADRETMAAAIRDFGKRLGAAGSQAVGLFYFAGHGVQARGINFLIPVGVPVETEADLETSAISAQGVLAQMEYAGNDLNIVILDACRDNPFAGGFRSAEAGLARMDAPSGALVAYAAGPGKRASDGTGDNSPYTAALAEAIRQPGLDLEDVFKRVRLAVEAATGRAQTPWEESSLKGDFYFIAPTAGATSPSPDTAIELAFWNSIKDSDNPAAFQAYLDKFPNGAFAALAHMKAAEFARPGIGGDGNAPAAQKYGDLVDAAAAGDVAAIAQFLADGVDVNERDGDGDTPLHMAAFSAGGVAVEALLAAGADPNARAGNEHTPLFHAADQGNLEAVAALLSAGADVNARSADGFTPLFYAVDKGGLEVVSALLAAGADVNAQDRDGDTPVDHAVNEGHAAVAAALRAGGGRCHNTC